MWADSKGASRFRASCRARAPRVLLLGYTGGGGGGGETGPPHTPPSGRLGGEGPCTLPQPLLECCAEPMRVAAFSRPAVDDAIRESPLEKGLRLCSRDPP